MTPTVHFDVKLSKRSGGGQLLKSVGLPNSGTGPKTTGEVLDSSDLDQLSDCDQYITPLCLRALYGFLYEPLVPEKNSYGIGEYADVIERILFEVSV